MVNLSDVRIGSKVQVRGCFGNDRAKRGLVTGVESNIKNGEPGIDYTSISDGEECHNWAYLHQVVSVVEF